MAQPQGSSSGSSLVGRKLRFETIACAKLENPGSGMLQERDRCGASRWARGGTQASETLTAHLADVDALQRGPHVDVASQLVACS